MFACFIGSIVYLAAALWAWGLLDMLRLWLFAPFALERRRRRERDAALSEYWSAWERRPVLGPPT